MKPAGVAYAIASFEYALGLARGEPSIDKPERQSVPGKDMLIAHAYAVQLSRLFQTLLWRFHTMRFPPLSAENARQLMAGASDAARRFELETRLLAPLNAEQAARDVPALRGGLPATWLRTAAAARYTLEIAAGERSLEDSIYPVIHNINAEKVEELTTFVPVLGELILASQVFLGRSFATGRILTDSEKAAAGIALVLPRVLSRLGSAAAGTYRITRNTITLVLEDLKVYSITRSLQRVARSANIASGLRVLSQKHFKEFVDLLQLLRAAARYDMFEFLKPQQIARLNFFLTRMKDSTRTAAWLNIIDGELPASVTGYQALKYGIKVNQREINGLKLLANRSNELVVHLPDTQPVLYPKKYQVQGVTYPDAMWRRKMIDIYSPDTGHIDTILDVIGRKQEQSPTIVVALLEDAKATRADIETALTTKFWPNSEFSGVTEIVIVDQRGVYVNARPNNFIPPFMGGILRLGLDDPDNSKDDYKDLLLEPDGQKH